MTAATSLCLDQVKVADRLPELAIDVGVTDIVLGALASRDWRPMHHDKDFAVERNGTRHIFVNTPHNAGYFERYITDWTGPAGRLGRIQFRMKDSVFPGDRMVFQGEVTGAATDAAGCAWVALALRLTVNGKTTTECTARVAIPAGAGDNPWKRRGDDWRP
jgi:acyl dehydratase